MSRSVGQIVSCTGIASSPGSLPLRLLHTHTKPRVYSMAGLLTPDNKYEQNSLDTAAGMGGCGQPELDTQSVSKALPRKEKTKKHLRTMHGVSSPILWSRVPCGIHSISQIL